MWLSGAGPISFGWPLAVLFCPISGVFCWHGQQKKAEEGIDTRGPLQAALDNIQLRNRAMAVLLVLALIFPLIFDTYQTNIMVTALIFVVLGLGLNIGVGLAGLLDLGYVAFFGVGAYSYAILNHNFDLGFWIVLPIGGILGCLFGIVLGFPILRLRGDYLAIVTLGFGMIFKVLMENWETLSLGPSGIANIDRPGFFGMQMSLAQSTTYIYYIMIALVVLTIIVTNRLKNSRVGRAWIALREDEIACVAMGIDMARTKLSAYALGGPWRLLGRHGRSHLRGQNDLYQPGQFHLYGIGNYPVDCRSGGDGFDPRGHSGRFCSGVVAGIPAGVFRVSDADLWCRHGIDDDFPSARADQQSASELSI